MKMFSSSLGLTQAKPALKLLAAALILGNAFTGATQAQLIDSDGDGVYDFEDAYKNDPTKFIDAWRHWSTSFRAATNAPLALMDDGFSVWTVEPSTSQFLQVSWKETTKPWQNYIFRTHAPVKKSGNIVTDSAWDVVWYVGNNDNNLYATYLSGGLWRNAAVTKGRNFERVHHVDSTFHVVWGRLTTGQDVAVYLSGGAWKEAVVPNGGAVAWTGMISSTRGTIGWDLAGNTLQRPLKDVGWTAEPIPSGGDLGIVGGGLYGFADTRYAVETVRQEFWYGTANGRVGRTLLGGVAAQSDFLGTAGSVYPHSPTYASQGANLIFCRDGYLFQDKIRAFYLVGNTWKNTPVGEFLFSSGDQADANSKGKLFYINNTTGQIEYLSYQQ